MQAVVDSNCTSVKVFSLKPGPGSYGSELHFVWPVSTWGRPPTKNLATFIKNIFLGVFKIENLM